MQPVLTTFLAKPSITWMTLLKHMGLKKLRLRLRKQLQIMLPLLGSLPRTQPEFLQAVIWETSLTWVVWTCGSSVVGSKTASLLFHL